MKSGTNVGGALSRLSSAALEPSAQLAQVGAGGKDAESAKPADSRDHASAESPPLIIRHTNLPALAPLQRLTPQHKAGVAQYLTFTEAVSLMLASKDMHEALLKGARHRAVQVEVAQNVDHAREMPESSRLMFDDFGKKLMGLGCNRLAAEILGIETSMLRAKWQPAPKPSLWPPTEKRNRAAAREHEREQGAQKATLSARLQKLDPLIGEAVFQVAASRRPPLPVEAEGPAAQTPGQSSHGTLSPLYNAIENGDVAMVRMGIREFLSLAPALISSSRKAAWLREPGGMCTLEIIGRRCCGKLEAPERRRYEAVEAYVDEIVSSNYLLPIEKLQLCVKLARAKADRDTGLMQVDELDTVRHAIRSSNPAVAAAVLLGIQNSSADPALKQSLLTAAASFWDGALGKCIDCLTRSLRTYEYRAPEWVNRVIEDLQRVKGTWE